MSVRVRIWFPANEPSGFSPGHASIEVDGGDPPGTLTMSPYPGGPTSLIWGPRADMEKHKKPFQIFTLDGMDETAIKEHILYIQRERGYSFLVDNCSMQVGECLVWGDPVARIGFEAGRPTPLFLPIAWGTFGSPIHLYHYLLLLQYRFPPGAIKLITPKPLPVQPSVQPSEPMPKPVTHTSPPPQAKPDPFNNSLWKRYWFRTNVLD